MYKSFVAAALAFAISPVFAIPPESFGFPSAPNDTALTVVYNTIGNLTTISEAMLLGPNGTALTHIFARRRANRPSVPAMEPTIAVNTARYRSLSSYNGSYLVLMVDPDASTPQNPSERFILHWMAPNMTASTRTAGPNIPGQVLTNSTPAHVPYARPMPPPTSDPHRYIQYAFQQPDNFTVPTAFSGFSAMNRTSFNLTEFISAAGLSDPAAAMFYFCSNKTGVPGDFEAMAGGTYPGGNGAAVTAGPGPAATTTGAATSGGASSTASAAAGNAAAPVEPATWVLSLLAAVGAFAFYAL